ncbi:uncharacterized protein LY89DRAFT_679585 [Mollisia scopiformis]|uniref:Uncharacterized protein n=1 Tax=Mollisia scopiformis TaxID=149040 RepID=A0A194XW38_MOLSC|nr:uncharacterized protein LY89DRAFT_679585 [Mollisia scopiformis]KUJ24448.1 hypothetical protein LY89DRAFT_679585 [Mollisia scopiformis]
MTNSLAGQLLLQLFFFAQAVSSTVFHTNCTIPTKTSDFVSGANVRSTLDVLYASLTTIFLCTWTAQHLCLPPSSLANGFFLRIWKATWRKLKWMLVALIMPEYLVGKALGEFVAAYRSSRCEDMQSAAAASKTEWTMTHAYYANMGGVILHSFPSLHTPRPSIIPQMGADHSQDIERSPREGLDSEPQKERFDATPDFLQDQQLTSSSEIRLGKQSRRKHDSPWIIRLLDRLLCNKSGIWRQEHDSWVEQDPPDYDIDDLELPVCLNSAQICLMMKKGLIQQLPSITCDEIEDKSKEDILVKFITLGQVIWFIIQLIARKYNGLPCAQLEIAVLGFALCTFVTYLLWLKKPKDIKIGTTIFTTQDYILDEDTKKRLVWLNLSGFFENSLYEAMEHTPSELMPNDMYSKEAMMFSYEIEKNVWWIVDYQDAGFIIGAVLLGACHCIAWNFQFPTETERIIWRVASLFTVAAMPIYYLVWFAVSLSGVSASYLGRIVYASYTVCRLFILVELFRTLAFLPPDAFLATWSGSIPHVS